MVLLHEHRGTPTALTVSHFPHGPTASFSLRESAPLQFEESLLANSVTQTTSSSEQTSPTPLVAQFLKATPTSFSKASLQNSDSAACKS